MIAMVQLSWVNWVKLRILIACNFMGGRLRLSIDGAIKHPQSFFCVISSSLVPCRLWGTLCVDWQGSYQLQDTFEWWIDKDPRLGAIPPKRQPNVKESESSRRVGRPLVRPSWCSFAVGLPSWPWWHWETVSSALLNQILCGPSCTMRAKKWVS